MRKVFSLLIALMLVMSLAVPAFAATTGGSLVIDGKDDYTFKPGSTYHMTDLFDAQFKNVMPGDKISEKITIKGNFGLFTEDSVRVWIQAVKHDEKGNPLQYSETQEQAEGKDQEPVITGARDETVATMEDFLKQLTLTVTNADTGKKIYSGPANGTFDKTLIATLRSNKGAVLNVTLEVPEDLGNEYANRVGEVDWLLTVEAWDDPDVDNPKTGDYIMMAVAVMFVSAAALVVVFAAKKRKK